MPSAEGRVDQPSFSGARLDVFLSEGMGLFSRSQVKTRVTAVRVNGAAARLSRRLKPGDVVSVDFTDPPPLQAEPEDIHLTILFENDQVLVLDKPQGMVVHPGSGNHGGTLVNALLYHCREIAERFGTQGQRPGIVHRLDKETSGVMIVAKNPAAHQALSDQFKSHNAKKGYLAVIVGSLPERSGKIESRIFRDPRHRTLFTSSDPQGLPPMENPRGRLAVTRYAVLRTYAAPGAAGGPPAYSLISLRPRTGRTHQLRVHMRLLRTPILGDSLYGRPDARFARATLMLHSHRLTIRLPGEEAPRTFTARIPERFRSVLRSLQSVSPR